MDEVLTEKKGKGLNIAIGIVVILLIGLGCYMLIDFMKNKLNIPEVYTVEGPNGAFTFVKANDGNIVTHVIRLSASDATVNARFGINETREIAIPFRYGPKEVQDIAISNDSVKMILDFDKILNTGTGLLLTYDPYEKSGIVLSAVEIGRVLGTESYGVFRIPLQIAYSKDYKDDERPVFLCNQTDGLIGVIHFTLGEENKVFKHPAYQSCIVVEGKSYDELIRVSDALIYNALGVIDTTKSNDEIMGEGVHLKDYTF